MQTDTPESLLGAVGVDWKHTPKLRSPLVNGRATYTGPALGTPELDALLLVAGLAWLRHRNDWRFKHNFAGFITKSMADDDPLPWDDWLIWHCPTPGHALAAAIAEVKSC
jgi:hypothetical protein